MAKDHETASLSQVPETAPTQRPELDDSLANTPLEVGAVVDRYTVRSPLGAGGMGEVYLANDPELDRLVALKLIRPDRLGAPARSRFLREAQALAKLSHPNVVTVFDAGEHQGRVFIAMERLAGETLAVWMGRRHTWREVRDVFVAAGRGLAAAHAAGIVHRDFKPHNVLIGPAGVKVLDFGLARSLGDPPEATPVARSPALAATGTGDMMGTPLYMAPEVLGGGRATEASDQYSFSVSLYESLAGRRPFSADSFDGLAAAMRGGVIPPPPGVPRWLSRVVLRGLARDPGARFPSMDALLRALGRDPARATRRALLIGGGAAVLAAAGFLAASLRGQDCGASLGAAWDARARDAMERAFAEAGGPQAKDAFARVAGRLDIWTARWIEESAVACRAPAADTRAACLENVKSDLGAIVSALTREIKPGGFDDAIALAASLPDVSACANVGSLVQTTPLPADPVVRERAAALRERIAELRAVHELDDEAELMPQIEAALPELRALGVPAVLAEGLHLQASFLDFRGRFDEARRVLEEQILVATQARDDVWQLRGWLELQNALVGLKRWDEVLAVSLAARSTARRANASASYLGHIEAKVASAWQAKGSLEPAEAHARLALELQRADPHRTDTAIEDGLANLANIVADRGDVPGAIALYRKSMEETERVYGPDSPHLAERRVRLAMFLSRGGDWAGADALLQAAMPALLAAQGDDHHSVILGLSFWATVADKLGHPGDALARLDRAIAGAEQETELGNLLPRLLERRGSIRLATDDAAGAQADFDRAKTLAAQKSR